jgi:hypothetical protein
VGRKGGGGGGWRWGGWVGRGGGRGRGVKQNANYELVITAYFFIGLWPVCDYGEMGLGLRVQQTRTC